ncbi:7-carboxy-7-deazaguanine synthase QueE [Aureitalea sp. L0-47]|uniref:7-carboxy-7-deazaguanine synthase QueE n=1 Tax=Aureitalea sp. L0-47 TaxID=2816962 RepID=UPI0022386E7F|nr:7-carboxy-7-deazaguanine synthase QueE [Aureitalea sp. L0-47]MCW5520451.1 7-carboxy-7-deazaguanine synthase QueE [Aureitalea sp. L0-47]
MTRIKLAKLHGRPEIFHSIQGEGKNMGQPSVFIRTSLCNLHCIWCDTDYTWNWENTRFKHNNDSRLGYKKFKMEEMIHEATPQEIVGIVEKTHCRNIVLTGGEPMMQQKELTELMAMFHKNSGDYYFEVETNGTLIPEDPFDSLIHQYNVSPKLSNSNNSRKLREKPAALSFFARSAKSNFKFVISEEKDLEEVLEIIKRYNISPETVYLMPEGINPEQLKQRQVWLLEVCKKYNFKYTDRLHIRIFGDKRGV